ncbi:MAG: hypothetical protein R3350_04205, partial [Saprospiraceae bacterium]|nr:hypothetical protein [Saprospiraceae bacterium]
MRTAKYFLFAFITLLFFSCEGPTTGVEPASAEEGPGIDERLDKYVEVKLTADLSHLSDDQREMISLLIEAGKIMDELFWVEAFGEDWEAFLENLPSDDYRQFARINYGPWDRLAGNEPFIEGAGPKPAGANFYPRDMSKAEFEAADLPGKASLYTFLRRNEAGELITVPYHEKFNEQVQKASDLLSQAAELAQDAGLKRYLQLRSEAMLDDNYQESDMAWMDMKQNAIDVVIGPIETYEDQLFGYKAAHEAYVLVKDMEWSERLEKYTQFLPELQRGLPVDDKYKQELPGTNSELNAYDVIFYAGDCNAGSKTIAINLPN